uniref:Retrotransposon gag domain-containing protein n=1 Tax=Romanomermis culicivorax TaxID=13658 RepID=A0A915KA70_ROMCU
MMLKGIKGDNDAPKLVFLEFHLGGDALTKFENISNSPNPPGTYNRFKIALLAAFPIVQDVPLLFQCQILLDRKQKRTETVTAYFNELEKLGRLAYSEFNVGVRENLIEPVFWEGLLSDIKNGAGPQCPARRPSK